MKTNKKRHLECSMLSEVMLVFCHALALTETVAIGFSGWNYNPAFILEGTVGYFINKREKKKNRQKKTGLLVPLLFF